MDLLPIQGANKSIHHDALNLWKLWFVLRTFCLVSFLCLSFSFSAASDHYLIGNNITVAVLGIVIPIGEYSCCLRSPASPCLLLHLRLSLKYSMLAFYIVWRVCVCAWFWNPLSTTSFINTDLVRTNVTKHNFWLLRWPWSNYLVSMLVNVQFSIL